MSVGHTSPDYVSSPKVSIVIPVYNEEAILPEAIEDITNQLDLAKIPYELIISENGSVDSTTKVAREISSLKDNIRVLSASVADYGSAIRAGINTSKESYIVVFDIDYYDIDFLRKAIALLQDYDIVIASKLAPDAKDNRTLTRRMITLGFSLVVKILFWTKTSETHGMKAFRRDAILPVFNKTKLGKDLFDTELIVRAERSGLRIKELPIVVEEKRPTRSSMIKRVPRTVSGLLYLRYLLWKEK